MKKYNCHEKIVRGFFYAVLALFLISGCMGKKRVEKDPFFDKWKVMAEESKGYSPTDEQLIIPDPETKKVQAETQVTEVSLEEIAATPEMELPADRITMRMHDIEVAVLLRALARAANQNIMINEKVKGKTS
ncbi:MAG: hypothetical protein JRI75_09500, partial [Deltaproteobacteria bacterium]|nr:hypothetical protein [Deltaproteobacteria bacterium]